MTDQPREITLTAEHGDDGEERKHTFRVTPKASYGDGLDLVGDGAARLTALDRILRRCLSNRDGTPAKWAPTIVDDHFTAPDGTHRHIDELGTYTAHDAGSSRRRFAELVADDDVYLSMTQVLEAAEALVTDAVTGDRPTMR